MSAGRRTEFGRPEGGCEADGYPVAERRVLVDDRAAPELARWSLAVGKHYATQARPSVGIFFFASRFKIHRDAPPSRWLLKNRDAPDLGMRSRCPSKPIATLESISGCHSWWSSDVRMAVGWRREARKMGAKALIPMVTGISRVHPEGFSKFIGMRGKKIPTLHLI